MSRKLDPIPVISCILGLIVIVAIFSFPYITSEEVVFKVTDKERVVTGGGDSVSSQYLIFTEDETFRNTDSFAYFKFNSSDLYGKLKIGETYGAKVFGWRIPFLGRYRNIVNVSPLKVLEKQ
jgi:hypothetical protein